MSGNTGKMTRDAVRLRGPRFVLSRVRGTFVIWREDARPFTYIVPGYTAKSYTMSYLLRIARFVNQERAK